MTTTVPVVAELRARVEKLRALGDRLNSGELLREALIKAQDQSVWVCPPGVALVKWLRLVDRWMQHHLGEGIELVAKVMEQQAEAIERYAPHAQMGTMEPPPPLGPVKHTVARPPDFLLEVGPPVDKMEMHTDRMRALVQVIGRASGAVVDFGRELDTALVPAHPSPGAASLGMAPFHNPPPDAAEAVGFPAAYQHLAQQIGRASQDVNQRAMDWERINSATSAATATPDTCLPTTSGAEVLDLATDAAAVAGDNLAPVAGPAPVATAPADVPQKPVQEQIDTADQLIEDYPPDKVVNNPEMAKELAVKLREQQGQEVFSSHFVERFGAERFVEVPRMLQAWEYQRIQMGMTIGAPAHEKQLHYNDAKPPPEDGEVEEILYSFSATLATASTNETASEKSKDAVIKVANTDDPLALSWLLTDDSTEFSPEFLVECFEQVEQAIIDEAKQFQKPQPGTGPITGRDGEPLSPDLKSGILNAISRNDAAAQIITSPSFSGLHDEDGRVGGRSLFPLTLERAYAPPVKVTDVLALLQHGAYADKGSSLGRMLDTAHRASQGSTESPPDQLAARIVATSTKDSDLSAMAPYLRRIGLRERPDDAAAQAALDLVKRDSDHPARELLLAEASRNEKAAAAFVSDAFESKARADVLYETQGAWDIVRAALTAKGASQEQRAQAEKVIEGTMAAIGDGGELDDPARRGLGEVLALRFDDLATLLLSPAQAGPELLQVTDAQISATLAEVARDKQGREALMVGVGGWSSKVYSDMAEMLRGGSDMTAVQVKFEPYMRAMGRGFCQVVKAVEHAGIKEREEAMALLSRYRLGVDIVFDVVEKIPVVGTVKAAVDGGLGKIPGGLAPDYEESMRSGIAQELSGADLGEVVSRTREEAQETMSQVDCMVVENMMSAMARRPQVLIDTGLSTFDRWPGFMLQDPPPVPGTPVSAENLGSVIRAQYLTAEGGVQFPLPGDENYVAFQQWYSQDLSNPLFATASFVTTSVRNDMNDCMGRIAWEENL